MISQKKAIQLAIMTLKDWRRRNYTAGEAAYQSGVRGLTFADNGHKHYVEYSEAIQQMEDLIEILEDPGVTVETVEEE